MTILSFKLILILLGAVITGGEASVPVVVSLLSSVIISALCQYLGKKRVIAALVSSHFVLSMFFPAFRGYIPLLCLDLFLCRGAVFSLTALVPLLINLSEMKISETFMLTLLAALAFITWNIYDKEKRLTEENKLIRDSGAERSRLLELKNKSLLEKQDYEIHLAALNERNRIAREIHDNVGHAVTSGLLQTGALLALNKNEETAERLNGIKDALTIAMDSIRKSVHDLKDDAISLYDETIKITGASNRETSLDYDMPGDVPKNIKYCFLAILNEAFTNIAKHSDAGRVSVTIREHPAIYQLLIQDDGSKDPFIDGEAALYGEGIGLMNITERVRALNGSFDFSYRGGFRIFISIPKEENGD